MRRWCRKLIIQRSAADGCNGAVRGRSVSGIGRCGRRGEMRRQADDGAGEGGLVATGLPAWPREDHYLLDGRLRDVDVRLYSAYCRSMSADRRQAPAYGRLVDSPPTMCSTSHGHLVGCLRQKAAHGVRSSSPLPACSGGK
jgi:hypothetical protein